ncbi:thioredoxin domain-containing protein 17 isoform X2 [Phalacrocorax carbo]|uniref:thioredoxin domain-containing protein 17 isoform X2 n=1 Tax=Phalacrocorax carbo TaxID=9209 RepID=UPI003119A6DE
MGWEEKQVRGYPEFVQTAQRYHGRPIFALFCGDKDAEGRSWCPDCVTAEPVVRKELHNMPEESVFIYCLVGDRAYFEVNTIPNGNNLHACSEQWVGEA